MKKGYVLPSVLILAVIIIVVSLAVHYRTKIYPKVVLEHTLDTQGYYLAQAAVNDFLTKMRTGSLPSGCPPSTVGATCNYSFVEGNGNVNVIITKLPSGDISDYKIEAEAEL